MADKIKVKLVQIIFNGINIFLKILRKLLLKNGSYKPEVICVHAVLQLGDTICMIPALYQIRKRYPDAKLILFTSSGYEKGYENIRLGAQNILGDEKWIDEIITYDYEELSYRNLLVMKKKIHHRLLSQKIDLFINFPGERDRVRVILKWLYITRIIKPGMSYGYYISTLRLFPKSQDKLLQFDYEVNRLINHLPFKSDKTVEFPIHISSEDKKYVDDMISGKHNIAVFSFSGKGISKKWPNESFRSLVSMWSDRGNVAIIVGGAKEYQEGEEISQNIKNAYNFCGLTTPKQCLYLISQARKIVTIDTGTAHMASAVSAKSVVIFSAFYFQRKWYPYGDNSIIIRRNLSCSPCLSKNCIDNKCMKEITVEEVWDKMTAFF